MSARLVVSVLAVAILGALAWLAVAPRDEAPAFQAYDVAEIMGGGDIAGYARAYAPRPFTFPRDHGPHPAYKHEWWYYTGNLWSDEGRRFGFQFTLFRIAMTPEPLVRASQWATQHAYMAHFALTDVAGRRFYHYQRFSRDALGLAGAQAEPFRIWLEDWEAAAQEPADGLFPLQLRVAAPAPHAPEVELELRLEGGKPLVLQGERGLSQKSAEPGNASYYYSYTRLPAAGTVRLQGREHRVRGAAWMDREWSSSALGADQAGWDWFSLQLSDGRELMYYQMRRDDGSVDPHSAGVLVAADGAVRRLFAAQVELQVTAHWDSPRGGRYPAGWRLVVPGEDLALEIRPLLADQELAVAVRYWEGAVEVAGQLAGQPVNGAGYVELTGYAR